MSWFRPNVVVFAACTSCGLVAYSTDDLSSGGTTPNTLLDASLVDGAVRLEDGAVVGDGGGPLPNTDGGSVVPGTDGASGSDAGKEIGCPANPCPGTDVCCYVKEGFQNGDWRCQASCPGGATNCVGPQQCAAGQLCCGTVTFGNGSIPNCDIDAIASSCTTSCTTNLGLSCNVTNTLRLCHQNADCATDPQNKNCCTYNGSGVSAIVCVSDLVRDVAGLNCLP